MKNNLISILIKLVCILLLSFNVYSSDDVNDSLLKDNNDIMLMDEFSSCTDQYEINDSENSNITSSLLLSGDALYSKGDVIISSTNAKAIVDSFDLSSNKLIYYQTAETGFKSFSLGEKLVGKGENVSIIEEFILDFGVPCSDLVVSIEESPEQMMFIFADSDEAIKAKLAAQEMMAEIETEMARQAALDAFQAKLAADKAAAAKSTAAYKAKLASEAIEREIDEFEAQLMEELLEESTGIELTITGETHNLCRSTLGLSEINIQLYNKALLGGYLGSIGPQVENGTEFSSTRWDNYISCISSLNSEL